MHLVGQHVVAIVLLLGLAIPVALLGLFFLLLLIVHPKFSLTERIRLSPRLFSAKGAPHTQPGESPQGTSRNCERALKARLNVARRQE